MALLIDLDLASVQKIIGDASQVMIYGFGHCKYLQLIYTLQQTTPPVVNKVFECSIGNSYQFPRYTLEDQYRTTLEGTVIRQFQPESLDQITDDKLWTEKLCTRVCKTGTVNLIFENFQRSKQGLPLIPFVFAIDVTNNPYPYNVANFASRNPQMNSLVTHSELRRCYKLANEFPDPRIRAIAAETFKFVKVNIQQNDRYSLQELPPFWSMPGWNEAWSERKAQANPNKLFKERPWKDQLLRAIAESDDIDNSNNAKNDQPIQK